MTEQKPEIGNILNVTKNVKPEYLSKNKKKATMI